MLSDATDGISVAASDLMEDRAAEGGNAAETPGGQEPEETWEPEAESDQDLPTGYHIMQVEAEVHIQPEEAPSVATQTPVSLIADQDVNILELVGGAGFLIIKKKY